MILHQVRDYYETKLQEAETKDEFDEKPVARFTRKFRFKSTKQSRVVGDSKDISEMKKYIMYSTKRQQDVSIARRMDPSRYERYNTSAF